MVKLEDMTMTFVSGYVVIKQLLIWIIHVWLHC